MGGDIFLLSPAATVLIFGRLGDPLNLILETCEEKQIFSRGSAISFAVFGAILALSVQPQELPEVGRFSEARSASSASASSKTKKNCN